MRPSGATAATSFVRHNHSQTFSASWPIRPDLGEVQARGPDFPPRFAILPPEAAPGNPQLPVASHGQAGSAMRRSVASGRRRGHDAIQAPDGPTAAIEVRQVRIVIDHPNAGRPRHDIGRPVGLQCIRVQAPGLPVKADDALL
jgi:hypothetical protein